MHDSDQLDSFRYAQMQSSILNKTNSSTSSSKGNRFNLLSKFSSLESTLNAVESDLRQLSADTQVHKHKRRNRYGFLNRLATTWLERAWTKRGRS